VSNKIQSQNIIAEKWPAGLEDAGCREENSDAPNGYMILTEKLKNGEISAGISTRSCFHFQYQGDIRIKQDARRKWFCLSGRHFSSKFAIHLKKAAHQ